MNRILITGAVGFIGAFLCKRLLETTDARVVGLDNVNDYYDVGIKKDRLRMLAEAAETLPDNARPVVHSDRGCHYRWPGWLELMERYGLTRSMSAKGCSPDNAAAEGFFGRMKTESVYPEHWEKRTRDEVLVLIDEYIHWYNHERIKQSLGWMSPVQYRQSQGMAA